MPNINNSDIFLRAIVSLFLCVFFWYSLITFKKGNYLTLPEKMALTLYRNNPEKTKSLLDSYTGERELKAKYRDLRLFTIITTALSIIAIYLWLTSR